VSVRVTKEKIPVVLLTTSHRMEGEVHVIPGGRLLDELNKNTDFLPITNVTVYELDGETPLDTVDFIAVNKKQIIFLTPSVGY
jgi:hypothetical protein